VQALVVDDKSQGLRQERRLGVLCSVAIIAVLITILREVGMLLLAERLPALGLQPQRTKANLSNWGQSIRSISRLRLNQVRTTPQQKDYHKSSDNIAQGVALWNAY
jgi:hypothetical protein